MMSYSLAHTVVAFFYRSCPRLCKHKTNGSFAYPNLITYPTIVGNLLALSYSDNREPIVTVDLKRTLKLGRDERMQEDYPTIAVYFCRCQVVLLHSLISCLVCVVFSCPYLLEMKFCRNFLPDHYCIHSRVRHDIAENERR